MFGKKLSEYIAFQRPVLLLLAIVGFARLLVSLAGTGHAASFLSMNVISWAGAIYYGYFAFKRRFGTYQHLLPLVAIQMFVQQLIAVLGIVLAMAGMPNSYAAPEYTFGMSPIVHLAAHLTIGIVMPTLILWAVASLVMWITKKAS
jgi:hypothetical protein